MTNSEALGLPIGTTLDRFIKKKQDEFEYATGELSQLLRDIGLAGKIINREVNKSGLLEIGGAFGAKNVQGEDQQKLDMIANIRFTRALNNGGQVCAIVSEEDEEVIRLAQDGKYVVCMDPLDGSSNIDVNVSIGTIFSVYRRITKPGTEVQNIDLLQVGSDQVAAGYILYGSSTMLVYTTGHGVNGFTLEPSLGEFLLSHTNMTYPQDGKIYSINEGSSLEFELGLNNYLDSCKKHKYAARYIGSLVADFHRNMLKGGIYIYPASPKAPNGKLRLLYECNSLAFIAEQAGGVATNGHLRILDIEPKSFHQRAPLYIGSAQMVNEVMNYLN